MIKNRTNLLKILSVFTIVMLSVFTLTGCGKKDNKNDVAQADQYLQPIKNYFDGIKNKDVNQILKAFPDFTKMEEVVTINEVNDMYAQFEQVYGANIKIDYSFGDATPLSEEDLSELEAELMSTYTEAGNIDITAAYTVPVKVTITGDGIQSENNGESVQDDNVGEDESNQEDMYVLQYNGNWYML